MPCCGFAYAFRTCFGKSACRHDVLSGTFVALNASEIEGAQLPPQTTATLYEGQCPGSWLSHRVQEILDANPWVAGVLKTNPENGKLALWCDRQPQASFIFQVVYLEGNADVQRASLEFIVPSSSGQTFGAKPVCQITAMVQPRCKKWFLQLSMSHAVADSHTFYAIYGMLDELADVRSLEVSRIAFHPLACLKAPLHWKWLFFVLCRLCWLMSPSRETSRRPVIRVRYIRDEWLEQQKAAFVPDLDAPYVSANDLLTSWFLSVTQPSCGFMPMNMRGRMPGLGVEHAGVYTTMLIFYPEEYRRSANIRRAVTRQSPACTPDASRQRPGPGSTCGAVSAWHMFYRDVNLPGCKQCSHCPVTFVWENYPAGQFPMAVIFRPDRKSLAMCLVTCADLPEDPSGPLGAPFPADLAMFLEGASR